MQFYKPRGSNESWLISYADLITNLLLFFILILSASEIQTVKMEQIVSSITSNSKKGSLKDASQQLEKSIKEQNLQESVSINLTKNGLELIFDSGMMFESGSAQIFNKMSTSLNRVLDVLKPFSQKYRIAIEGHTDKNIIHNSTYKSNWELSSARAMSVRERLEKIGVSNNKIHIEAFADKKPLLNIDHNKYSPQEILSKQRRVTIRLY